MSHPAISLGHADTLPASLLSGMSVFMQAKQFAVDVLGLTGDAALQSANLAALRSTGINVLEQFLPGSPAISAPLAASVSPCPPSVPQSLPAAPVAPPAVPDSAHLTSYTHNQLCEFYRMKMHSQKLHTLLKTSGLVTWNDPENAWRPSAKADGLYQWVNGRQKGGVQIKQLRWFKQVLDHPDFVNALGPWKRFHRRIDL